MLLFLYILIIIMKLKIENVIYYNAIRESFIGF
jgi:hypothetical protein